MSVEPRAVWVAASSRIFAHIRHLQPPKDGVNGSAYIPPTSIDSVHGPEETPEQKQVAGTHVLVGKVRPRRRYLP